MLTSDFDYNLPPESIAQTPAHPRDSSKLMVVDKKTKTLLHRQFFQLPEFLKAGDVLVWNNSKVFKARLYGTIELDEASDAISDKREQKLGVTDNILNAKNVEIFLVRPMENPGVWKVLAKPAKKLRLGMKIKFGPDFTAEVMLKEKDGTLLVQFPYDDVTVRLKANQYGQVPLPPYIKQAGEESKNYQTVYAKREGSVAAPTAGFHFTPELIDKLKAQGVQFAEVTLHVGLGTFLPVKSDNIEEHQMHSEWVELTDKNAAIINEAKHQGQRIIAVGTTTVRTLEGISAANGNTTKLSAFTGDLNMFITPGFKFNIIDALITNFHLPKSTLLMLVSAFAGDRQFMLDCYQKSIAANYRFYSFGDAMLIVWDHSRKTPPSAYIDMSNQLE